MNISGMVLSRKLDELEPHPKNAEIYSSDISDDFLRKIERVGILEPLIITLNNVILSGHRRWLAAKKLGLDSVPVRVALVNDDLDEVDVLIACNDQRVKTFSEKAAEMAEMKKIEEERARRRQVEGKRLDLGENFPEGGIGRSSDIVGKKYGVSGKQVDKIVTIHEKAKDGDEQARGLMKELDAGKKSVNSAYQAIKNDGKPKTIAIVHVESNEQEQQAITVVAKEPQAAPDKDDIKQMKRAISAKDKEIEELHKKQERLKRENELLRERLETNFDEAEPLREIIRHLTKKSESLAKENEKLMEEIEEKLSKQKKFSLIKAVYNRIEDVERELYISRAKEDGYRRQIKDLEATLAESLGEEKKGA